MEDVHFGSKLISLGIKFVPVLSATTFHIKRHEDRRHKKKKQAEFAKNVRLYRLKARTNALTNSSRLLKNFTDVSKIEI